LRHIFGVVFDENGKVGIKRELEIFQSVLEWMQMEKPLFQIRIIGLGLKMLGPAHVQQMIDIF
jgi:hypothetical protein